MAEVLIPVADGEMPAHLALPEGDGPWPGVVVIFDATGMTRDARAQADRLAAAGFVAVTPNLYHRGAKIRCIRDAFRDLLRGSGPTINDLDAARAWLADRDDCTGRVGVIGFCMGGGFALVLAPGHGFDAAAPCYGQLPKQAETVLAGACPIVASYGRKDPMLRGAAAELESVLTRLEVEHDVKEYPDAAHSFLNDHGKVMGVLGRYVGFFHHPPSAQDAMARIEGFFDRHLRPSA